ncbi:hypothetical protein F5Y15DRAFT_245352 [Xylariaceae sp. FL0016]|nr:hypothetical protein F5Y15DRAFT_245352 [Xylariaceae sp. FL0016]
MSAASPSAASKKFVRLLAGGPGPVKPGDDIPDSKNWWIRHGFDKVFPKDPASEDVVPDARDIAYALLQNTFPGNSYIDDQGIDVTPSEAHKIVDKAVENADEYIDVFLADMTKEKWEGSVSIYQRPYRKLITAYHDHLVNTGKALQQCTEVELADLRSSLVKYMDCKVPPHPQRSSVELGEKGQMIMRVLDIKPNLDEELSKALIDSAKASKA